MKKIFSIILIAIIILTGCTINNPLWNNAEEEIKNTAVKINFENNQTFDFKISEEELINNKIFFTGEMHGIHRNEQLRFEFFKYFKEKTNFKYYLIEGSYSNAYFLNRYLETGNEKFLKVPFSYQKGTFNWNQDNYNHWKKIYDYNKKLKPRDKIKVVGIDIEHQRSLAFHYLNTILDTYDSETIPMKSLHKLIHNASKKDKHQVIKEIKKIQQTILMNEKKFKQISHEDLFAIKHVLKNIINNYEVDKIKLSSGRKAFNKARDRMMYKNFLALEEKLDEGKYFGQWGYLHAWQDQYNDVKYLADYIDDKYKYKNKILTISYVYEKCRHMSKENGKYKDVAFSNIGINFKNITKDLDGETILLNINKKESVFKDHLIWPIRYLKPQTKAKNTSDFFQYIVLIRNSEATKPLNE